MESRIDILNELKALSPAIAAIHNQNVFTVPAGYFDHLAEGILMNVKEGSGGLVGAMMEKDQLTVPAGYFDSLADTILNKIKAQETGAEELKALSPMLAAIPNNNLFTVPAGYFESLADVVLNKAATNDTAAAELRALSPMLYSIQNENVFTVPHGYFESLPATILDKVQSQPAKLVSIKSRRTFSIVKYAVAAMFTGLMALGLYKFTGGSSDSIIPAIANVPDYNTINRNIKNVDDELAKVSDDDIIKYLQANGSDVDAALVANTIDEKELPTQDDYLTDDKALDKYLDNVDLKDLKN
jgi:hypothetical protein